MDLLTATYFLNSFLMIALPILLGIYLIHKFHLGWKIWLVGVATFIIAILLESPFNAFVLSPLLGSPQGIAGNPIAALVFGLSAGVFEETARYGMLRWWLKDKHTWRVAVLAGAGHGGIESIYFGVGLLWLFINMLAVRHADLSKLNLTPSQLEIYRQQVAAYWSLPWFATFLPVVERIFTIPFHIMAYVLVLQVFTRRPGMQQLGWLGLAIFFHAMMNATAGILAGYWSVYAVEALLGGLAVVDILIIFALRQPEPAEPSSPPTPKAPPIFTPEPVEETSENLDKTRYQ